MKIQILSLSLPCIDMPTSKHFLNRHDLHLLRFSGLSGQQLPKKQRYFSLRRVLLLKKPLFGKKNNNDYFD